jgi:hypothetical protein
LQRPSVQAVIAKAAAEAVVAEWERAAADPNYVAASTATLSQALKLLVDDREQQAKAGRRADSTVAFYREKAGVLTRLLETDELVAEVERIRARARR